MKKISVIIPVKNTGIYLKDCINSVLEQTYQNFEIIIIDDDSESESKQIIKCLALLDERVKVVTLEKQNGVGFARNKGLEQAVGDYIYFLDSDDYIREDTLESLLRNAEGFSMIVGKTKITTTDTISLQKEEQNVQEDIKVVESAETSAEGETSNLEEDITSKDKTVLYKKKRAKLFKNRSVLNRLISRDFIEEHGLRFTDQVKHQSDLAFLVPALVNLEQVLLVKNSVYYKRRRNDPINNPSLNQSESREKVRDFLQVYNTLRETYTENTAAEKYLDQQFLNYYRKQIAIFIKNPLNIDEIYDLLESGAKKVDANLLKNKSIILRKEMKTLRTKDLPKYKSVIKFHNNLRQIRNMTKSKNKFFLGLYRLLFMKMPVKDNVVVLESFQGKNYNDSPKYIYEYMMKQYPEYDYVWSLNDLSKVIPGNPKKVKRLSLRYYYNIGRAKYWISNARMPNYLNKRQETTYLQTWHGTPLKKLAADMGEVSMPGTNTVKYKRNFVREAGKWDYLVSPNNYSSKIFKRAFQFQNKMLETGYPRNDILSAPDKEKLQKDLKNQLNLPQEKKVILYAPTWRDNEFFERGKYKFNLQLDLEQMRSRLGDDYVVVLRMHYLIANQLDISEFEGFAYDFSKYDDIGHLYLVSDILVTDYSSVFFDYANLKRPILFYTYDLDVYKDTLRGFYFDIENEAPGPLLKNTEQVIKALENIDSLSEDYAKRYHAFYTKFCAWDEGNAAEKVVQQVFNK
ncbi:glycosyltransferase [Sediminibacillus dalangtanensis]|uniref:Glycosyltransferase n=1 Tax=Sediminibacillus dalangtanensis TaxID=2729421 RepID=A0ABX7VXP2_9BACI|nr:bifunctional glycosyltransferase family 2 protein/CDP-glycerol:glycerophosphate glycerophosphotransferase [Sediminibacillus dalangtanensis]QTN00810.1 glycosyltransferase [Sediminibacillus dalangtanensis]